MLFEILLVKIFKNNFFSISSFSKHQYVQNSKMSHIYSKSSTDQKLKFSGNTKNSRRNKQKCFLLKKYKYKSLQSQLFINFRKNPFTRLLSEDL